MSFGLISVQCPNPKYHYLNFFLYSCSWDWNRYPFQGSESTLSSLQLISFLAFTICFNGYLVLTALELSFHFQWHYQQKPTIFPTYFIYSFFCPLCLHWASSTTIFLYRNATIHSLLCSKPSPWIFVAGYIILCLRLHLSKMAASTSCPLIIT